jgi:hypothetical protein
MFASCNNFALKLSTVKATRPSTAVRQMCLARHRSYFSFENHLLHANASNAVRTGRSVNGNRLKLNLYRFETPWPIKTKLNNNYNVRGNSTKAKTYHQPLKGAPPIRDQHISFLLVFSFLFCSFLVTTPSKNGRPILTIYTSNDSVSRKKVPFGGPNASKNCQRVHFPPTPKIHPGIEISSFKKKLWTTFQLFVRLLLKLA